MGRTRDIIREIAEVRDRHRFKFAGAEIPIRLLTLERAFEGFDKKNEELTRYFPVALVACIEAYFRMAIKELVDAGEPFLTNAEKPASAIRLDFDVLRAIHGKTITVGELVAHGAQINRLEDIDRVMSSLIGTGFLEALGSVASRWEYEVMGKPKVALLSEADSTFAGVARTFELRHIICHEIASAYEIVHDEVAGCFESCASFLRASVELVTETMYPGAPLTQAAMNEAADKSLQEKNQQLEQAVAKLRGRLREDERAAFDDSNEAWQWYCDTWAEFVAGPAVGGGSMWPMVRARAAESLVEERILRIRSYRRLSDPIGS